jgi:hypothetical protein
LKKEIALRMAGILALLMVGGVLSGAWAAGEEATVPTVLGKGDLLFTWLADQLKPIIGATTTYIPPEIDDEIEAGNLVPLVEVTKEGGKVTEIFIYKRWIGYFPPLPPEPDDGDRIGAARSLDDGPLPLSCTAEIPPRGEYYVWMANADTIGLRLPIKIELHWFIVLVDIGLTADGKIDIRDIAAIAFYQDREYRTPEEMLKMIAEAILRGCPPPPKPEPEPPPPEPEPPIS